MNPFHIQRFCSWQLSEGESKLVLHWPIDQVLPFPARHSRLFILAIWYSDVQKNKVKCQRPLAFALTSFEEIAATRSRCSCARMEHSRKSFRSNVNGIGHIWYFCVFTYQYDDKYVVFYHYYDLHQFFPHFSHSMTLFKFQNFYGTLG